MQMIFDFEITVNNKFYIEHTINFKGTYEDANTIGELCTKLGGTFEIKCEYEYIENTQATPYYINMHKLFNNLIGFDLWSLWGNLIEGKVQDIVNKNSCQMYDKVYLMSLNLDNFTECVNDIVTHVIESAKELKLNIPPIKNISQTIINLEGEK